MTKATSQQSGVGSNPTPAVELTDITKRYGAVVACDQVDLALHRGEIHGILGENGAGKSTLMKILIGLVLPDAGSISIDGKAATILDPLDAAELGIGMVHQHFSLVDALTVWENVSLGDAGRLDPAAVRSRIGEISDEYGLAIDPYAKVEALPAGLRQRVEIIKCLRRNPSIVIFDEPTSVLTPDESAQLFSSLRNVVAAEGRAVVLVSHKLDEILGATDQVTIMRQGQVVDRRPTSGSDAATLATAMVGRSVSLRSERAALGVLPADLSESATTEATSVDPSAAPVLEIVGATVSQRGSSPLLDNLNLSVRPGEIVGVAGVEGNGQRVLGDLLSSLVSLDEGEVRVNGVKVSTSKPGAMGKAGVSVIPEDRHDSGVVLDMSVAENLVLVDQDKVARGGIINRHELDTFANQMIADFGIMCAGPDAPLWSLSGGNQQRVVLARELAHDPVVLVAAQPTRGLDVGAIEYMTDRLREAAADGVGVLLISSELEEIMDLADRIVVMYRGSVIGEMERHEADLDRLGMLMGGSTL